MKKGILSAREIVFVVFAGIIPALRQVTAPPLTSTVLGPGFERKGPDKGAIKKFAVIHTLLGVYKL